MSAPLNIRTLGHGGTDTVLLHGWGMHSGVLEPLARELALQHRVHLIDLPGHGINRDTALPLQIQPLVDEIIQEIPRALWLGWSLGGLFALHAALHHPMAVSGLALIAANACFVRRPHWPDGEDALVFKQFAAELEHDYGAVLNRFLALETIGSEQAGRQRQLLRKSLDIAPDKAALLAGLELLQHTDFSPYLGQIAQPALLVAGQRDRIVRHSAMEVMAERMPAARLELISGAGHAPFIGHRQAIAAWVHALNAAPSAKRRRACGQ